MLCPDCGGRLRVYKTVPKSSVLIKRYKKCLKCEARFSSDETLGARISGAESKEDAIYSLTKWGVEPENAKTVVERTPVNIIKQYSNNLPLLMMNYEDTSGVKVKDPAGFLVWSITQRRDIPKPVNGNGRKPSDEPGDWIF